MATNVTQVLLEAVLAIVLGATLFFVSLWVATTSTTNVKFKVAPHTTTHVFTGMMTPRVHAAKPVVNTALPKSASFSYTFWLQVSDSTNLQNLRGKILFCDGIPTQYVKRCAEAQPQQRQETIRIATPCIYFDPVSADSLVVTMNTVRKAMVAVPIRNSNRHGVVKFAPNLPSFMQNSWVLVSLVFEDTASGIRLRAFINDVAILDLTPETYPDFAGNHIKHNEGRLYIMPELAQDASSPQLSNLTHYTFAISPAKIRSIYNHGPSEKEAKVGPGDVHPMASYRVVDPATASDDAQGEGNVASFEGSARMLM